VKLLFKKILLFLFAILLLILGILGVILPIMPGVIFLIPAIFILSLFFPKLNKKLNYYQNKYPKIRLATAGFEKKIKEWFGIKNDDHKN